MRKDLCRCQLSYDPRHCTGQQSCHGRQQLDTSHLGKGEGEGKGGGEEGEGGGEKEGEGGGEDGRGEGRRKGRGKGKMEEGEGRRGQISLDLSFRLQFLLTW